MLPKIYFANIFLILLCCLGNWPGTGVRAQTYEVNVHPGQELLTIIQLLAEKYPPPNASTYERDVRAHFDPFADHPAVAALAAIPGRVYTDFPEMGWCIYDFPNYQVHLPDSISWYGLYGRDTVRNIVRRAVDFARETDFWTFYRAHEADYRRWGAAVRRTIDSLDFVGSLDRFYRDGSGAAKPTFYVALDPLNSWGAHAIPHLAEMNPHYATYKAYSLGFWDRQSTRADAPHFAGSSFLSNLVWHEGSHIYLNDMLAEQAARIDSLAYLFNAGDRALVSQGVETWERCLEENVVRGIVVALTRQHRSHRNYREQNARELLAGFLYAEALADWITADYLGGDPERPFQNYLPQLLARLGEEFKAVPE